MNVQRSAGSPASPSTLTDNCDGSCFICKGILFTKHQHIILIMALMPCFCKSLPKQLDVTWSLASDKQRLLLGHCAGISMR